MVVVSEVFVGRWFREFVVFVVVRMVWSLDGFVCVCVCVGLVIVRWGVLGSFFFVFRFLRL